MDYSRITCTFHRLWLQKKTQEENKNPQNQNDEKNEKTRPHAPILSNNRKPHHQYYERALSSAPFLVIMQDHTPAKMHPVAVAFQGIL